MSHHEVVRDTTESGLARLIDALAVIMPVAGLFQTLANLGDYRQPAVAVAVWAGLLAAAAWLLPRVRLEGLGRGQAAVAVSIAVAAVTAIGWEHQPQRGSGGVDLAVLGTVWLLALVALSQPAWTWIPAALAVFTIHAVLVIRSAGAGAASLAQLEAAGYILATILTAFTALRPTLAMHIRISARRAALASRLTAERAAADAVRAERRRGLARLEHEALPLLRGIAEGRLDPADAGVRERCGRHAAALRDSLTGPAPAAVGLMSVLGPALRAARARGVMVNVQVIGDPGVPPPDVAREIGATVEAALGALPPHQVMLTVLAAGEEAELYLTSSEPELDCVQLSWRSSANSSGASPSGASPSGASPSGASPSGASPSGASSNRGPV